ncbi:hypothetical protein SOVF_090960 [Spinacia oleracea]|nr:hypothetical protein SOVF_090960 [Spinacia oleracea]
MGVLVEPPAPHLLGPPIDWSLSVIGRFYGPSSPPLSVVQHVADTQWVKRGPIRIRKLGNFFVFLCTNPTDREALLQIQSTVMDGSLISFRRGHDEVVPHLLNFDKAKLWANLLLLLCRPVVVQASCSDVFLLCKLTAVCSSSPNGSAGGSDSSFHPASDHFSDGDVEGHDNGSHINSPPQQNGFYDPRLIHNSGRVFSGSVRINQDTLADYPPRNYMDPIPCNSTFNVRRGGPFRVYAPIFEGNATSFQGGASIEHGFTFHFGRDNATFEIGESSRHPGGGNVIDVSEPPMERNVPTGSRHQDQNQEGGDGYVGDTVLQHNNNNQFHQQQDNIVHGSQQLTAPALFSEDVYPRHYVSQRQRDPSQNFVEGKPQIFYEGVFHSIPSPRRLYINSPPAPVCINRPRFFSECLAQRGGGFSLPTPMVIPTNSIPVAEGVVAEKLVQQVSSESSGDPSTPREFKTPSHSPTTSLVSKFEASWPKKRSRPGGYESERGSSVREVASRSLYCDTDWQHKRRKLRLKKLSSKADPKKDHKGGNKSGGGSKGKGGGAKPTGSSSSGGGKPFEKRDKGKQSFSDSKVKNRDCFLCGGPHWARECPQRQKLNAMFAGQSGSTGESSGDEAQMGTLRLLSNVKATVEQGYVAKVSTLPRSKKSSLMFVEAVVNGKASKALVDTGATHNFVALREATRLGLRYTKESGTLKTVNTSPVPIHGVARGVSLQLGDWKGTVDLTVVPMDDFSMVLGLEFMDTVAPWTMQRDGTMIIARDQEACSVPVAREVVEAKMLSVVQVKKGIKKGQATFVATLIEEGPQPSEVPKEVAVVLKELRADMTIKCKTLPPRRWINMLAKHNNPT